MVGVFADDSKIFHTLETQNDTTILQGNLSKIEYWSRTWQIKFNLEKCEAMRITHARDNSKPWKSPEDRREVKTSWNNRNK